MPVAVLQFNPNRIPEVEAARLARELPDIIAPNLNLPEKVRHDGQVTPEDIIVWCDPGHALDVNTKDIEILIWAHDFPERRENIEDRKEAILDGVRASLAHVDYKRKIDGYVWILLQSTAFGQI